MLNAIGIAVSFQWPLSAHMIRVRIIVGGAAATLTVSIHPLNCIMSDGTIPSDMLLAVFCECTVDSNTTVQGSDCGGLCADFGCNICATTSATCPAGSYVVAITGSAGGSFYEVTDLGPLLCSDGTTINLHPSEGECVLRTSRAPKNSTARKGKREQSPQSLTIKSPSGFTGAQMYGGCVLDMFRPISTLAHFTEPQKFFGDDSLEGVAVYTSACPTGHLLSGLTVSWSDWETLIDGGAGIPFIPVKVGLQCREAVGKCAL